jgi:LysM repeat protein
MKYFFTLILLLSTCTHANSQLFDSPKSLNGKYSNKYYKVQKGDTLRSIAQKFNQTMSDIVQWNDLKNIEEIYVGRELIVSSRSFENDVMESGDEKYSNKNYKVQKGDTLRSIAQKFDQTMSDIVQWNDLKNIEEIYVGRELIVSNVSSKNDVLKSGNNERPQLEQDRQPKLEERRVLDTEKQQREESKSSQRLNLQVSNTSPDNEGEFTINIKTNTDTASLKINGMEQNGKADGNYSVKLVARAGQTSTFTVIAKDIFGNIDSKTLSVSRAIADSSNKYVALNPALIKSRASSDAVAIIIGIQNYRRIPKADFANDDAKDFYDYAIRALGIKPENIKLLIDDQADDIEILATFQSWLPLKVRKQKSDVYVFFSGHGLPSEDGKNLYFLTYGTDKQYLDRTALNQQTIVSAIQAAQPKSVTMFIDACYSGQSRTGETLVASARPISLKQSASIFPPEFTVFSASAPDQLSSSSPELKHGIFSYYLMRGMEGDADENKDGKITAAELQGYVSEMAGRQAMSLNRRQQPQLIGDSQKTIVESKK